MSDQKGKGKEKETFDVVLDEDGIPVDKKDLPYGGDRLEALRAQDRKAIVLIMRWGNKYGQTKIVKKEVDTTTPVVPEIAKECNNTEDYISQETWSDNNKPNIFIKYMKDDGTFEGTFCYKSEDIMTMINSSQNNFAAWVRSEEDASFDDNGFVIIPGEEQKDYANASKVELFVEIPVRRFFFKDILLFEIENTHGEPTNFLAIPTYKTRVGNLDGSYGSGQLHGQEPDRTIYYLMTESFYNYIMSSDDSGPFDMIYDYVYKLKTNTVDTDRGSKLQLSDIFELQQSFPTAEDDILYYWLGDEIVNNVHASGVLPVLEPIDGIVDGTVDMDGNVPIELTMEEFQMLEKYWLSDPDEDNRIRGMLFFAIYVLYSQDKVLQYDGIEYDEVLGAYLTNVGFSPANNLDNTRFFLTPDEALRKMDSIIIDYRILAHLIQDVPVNINGTLAQDINTLLSNDPDTVPLAIYGDGNILNLVYRLFELNVTLWCLVTGDNQLNEIRVGTKYTWLRFVGMEQSWRSITNFKELIELGINPFLNKVKTDNGVLFQMMKIEYHYHEGVLFDIDEDLAMIYISLYHIFKAGYDAVLDGDVRITHFVKHDPHNLYTNRIDNVYGLLEVDEYFFIYMVISDNLLYNTLESTVNSLCSNDYICDSFSIANKIDERLNEGKTLFLKRYSGGYHYEFVDQVVENNADIVKFSSGDDIDLENSTLIALFLFDDSFRLFLDPSAETSDDFLQSLIKAILINNSMIEGEIQLPGEVQVVEEVNEETQVDEVVDEENFQ